MYFLGIGIFFVLAIIVVVAYFQMKSRNKKFE